MKGERAVKGERDCEGREGCEGRGDCYQLNWFGRHYSVD